MHINIYLYYIYIHTFTKSFTYRFRVKSTHTQTVLVQNQRLGTIGTMYRGTVEVTHTCKKKYKPTK